MDSDAVAVCYGLGAEKARDLVDELAREYGMSRQARLALVAGGPTSTAAALGRAVEHGVFGAEFGNSAEELAREYGPYEATSHFLVVVDVRARRPAGVMRTISAGPAGLKSVNDLAEPFGVTPNEFLLREGLQSLDDCLDLATMAVHPEYRGWLHRYRVSLLLYRALFLATSEGPLQRYVAIMDEGALASPKVMGIPYRAVRGTTSFTYLGSPGSHAISVPVPGIRLALSRHAEQLRARYRPHARDLLRPTVLLRRRLTIAALDDLISGRGLDSLIHLRPRNREAT